MKFVAPLLAALALCAAQLAHAQPTPLPDAAESEAQKKAEQLLASLRPQHGAIKLPGDIATLQLNDDFYYLSPGDAGRLLSEGWGNPPDQHTLGMVLPAKVNPLSQQGWGVIVTYDEDGHISDDDAAKIDYAALLKKMQSGQEDENAQRQKDGYAPLHLVGWAEPPHYEAQSHKLYWALELREDGAGGSSLNYRIRVLGRKGVLALNAVAGIEDLAMVKQEMPNILAFTNFNAGNRYGDFDASTDKVAAYGLAALVAGGIAAKAGLFAKLGLLLLAAKKFIVIGLVAVVSFVRKLFGGKPPPPKGPLPPPRI